MDNNTIKVPVQGGYLVARRNVDPDYDGIHIVFETTEGYEIDIVTTECKNNGSTTDVYCYENITSEDFTKKYQINHDDITNYTTNF